MTLASRVVSLESKNAVVPASTTAPDAAVSGGRDAVWQVYDGSIYITIEPRVAASGAFILLSSKDPSYVRVKPARGRTRFVICDRRSDSAHFTFRRFRRFSFACSTAKPGSPRNVCMHP